MQIRIRKQVSASRLHQSQPQVGQPHDEIERDALDFYARLRSLYRQRREAEIRNDVDALSDEVAAAERID